jgi:heme-degrading monooxygenase HmoA
MRARSNTVRIDPTALDRLTAFVREDVMGMYRDMDGFVGLSVLADRGSGRCIITTAWESEDAMHATDAKADASRSEILKELGGGSFQVELWDVVAMHRLHETREGACARVIYAHGMAGTLEETVDTWRATVQPALDRLPGFCSVSLLADRGSQRAVASTVYESREARDANASAASALRDQFRAAVGMTVDEVAEFDVVLAHLRVPELA